MPEMPEVMRVVKDLKPKIIKRKILKVEVFQEKLLKNCTYQEFKNFLENESILDITNYGKHIIYHLSNDKYLLSHLRMTGKYFTFYKFRPASKHDYVLFYLSDQSVVYYNDSRQFGTFYIKNKENLWNTKPLAHLAKTPKETDINWLYEKLKHKTIPIKSALLDQSLVVGLGNIYVNESLFACKINPLTKAKNVSLKQLKDLLYISSQIMVKSYKLGGSSIDSYTSVNGVKGTFQNFLKVHGKENKPCSNCHNPIKKIYINKRGTYFCLNCQKETYEEKSQKK